MCLCVRVCLSGFSFVVAPCSWLPVLVCCLCVCAWGLQKSKAAPLPEVLGIWANLVGGVCFQSALKAQLPCGVLGIWANLVEGVCFQAL